jgi:hypothetical protein
VIQCVLRLSYKNSSSAEQHVRHDVFPEIAKGVPLFNMLNLKEIIKNGVGWGG